MVALSVLIAILWLASPFQIGRTTFAVSFITDMLSGGGERRLGPFLFSHSQTVDGAMSTRAFAMLLPNGALTVVASTQNGQKLPSRSSTMSANGLVREN
jgi:hypothetical protein